MGYRRGTLVLLLGVVLLAGCSAGVSHPTALSATDPGISAPSLVAPSVAASASASPSAMPAASSAAQISASPISSGTPISAVSGSPAPTPADVIAMHVRATARAYIDDFNIALATGDVTQIDALTSTTCGCRRLVDTITQMSANGERFDGVVFTLKSIDVTFLAAGASGDVKYSISAGRVLDAAGNAVSATSPTPDEENDLFIIDSGDRWTVQQSILLGASNQ